MHTHTHTCTHTHTHTQVHTHTHTHTQVSQPCMPEQHAVSDPFMCVYVRVSRVGAVLKFSRAYTCRKLDSCSVSGFVHACP